MNKVAKNTVWNFIGVFVYLFSQWLMTILIVRLSGDYEEAGVFGIANSITNVFVVISNFSVRNYQVADINNRFSNGEYVTFRLITCAASLLVLPIYLIIMGYSSYIFLSVVCFMLLKTGEALIDVFQGIFQKAWRLDIPARSYIIRGILNLAIFSLTEWYFKNLIISLLLTAFCSLICGSILDFLPLKKMFDIKLELKNKRIGKLFICTLPVFIHGFLSVLIYNTPRIVAQKLCGEEQFGYFSSVSAPTVIIQLAVNCVFSPIVPLMAEQYAKREKKFIRTVITVQTCIVIIGACAIAGFALFGDPFLKLVFGEEILIYSSLLLPAVLAALLIANTAFIASVLVVLNLNVIMAILESIAFIAVIILSFVMIAYFGLQGVNYALSLSCLIFIVFGYCAVIKTTWIKFKNN